MGTMITDTRFGWVWRIVLQQTEELWLVATETGEAHVAPDIHAQIGAGYRCVRDPFWEHVSNAEMDSFDDDPEAAQRAEGIHEWLYSEWLRVEKDRLARFMVAYEQHGSLAVGWYISDDECSKGTALRSWFRREFNLSQWQRTGGAKWALRLHDIWEREGLYDAEEVLEKTRYAVSRAVLAAALEVVTGVTESLKVYSVNNELPTPQMHERWGRELTAFRCRVKRLKWKDLTVEDWKAKRNVLKIIKATRDNLATLAVHQYGTGETYGWYFLEAR